jgi:hypothetical protein
MISGKEIVRGQLKVDIMDKEKSIKDTEKSIKN